MAEELTLCRRIKEMAGSQPKATGREVKYPAKANGRDQQQLANCRNALPEIERPLKIKKTDTVALAMSNGHNAAHNGYSK